MKLSSIGRAVLAFFQPLLLFTHDNDPSQTALVTPGAGIASVPSQPIDITHLFDNTAVGPHATFDPRGESWAPEFMPTGTLAVNGIEYQLPQTWSGLAPDNVVSDGQEVKVPSFVDFAREMHVLYAGDFIDGETGATFIFHFEDGTEQRVEASIHNWWNLHWINSGAVVKAPYHLRGDGSRNYNQTQIFSWSTSIRTLSPLKSITLPGTNDWNRLHIFALTLVPSRLAGGSYLSFRQVRFTTKWRTIQGRRAYAVEATMASLLPAGLAGDPDYWINSNWVIAVVGNGVKTVKLGEYSRAMPGDQIIVDVWVVPNDSANYPPHEDVYQTLRQTFDSSPITIQTMSADGQLQSVVEDTKVEVEPDALLRDIPEWFGDAKFGIFMHWGVFAIPGWAPPGPYAEWYWWWQHTPMDSSNYFWNYHRDTFGPDFVYDDFIPQLGGKFDADSLIDIVASSGARYFVPTTMHHDGFAIFDTGNATHRSSVYLGPERDFLAEMFDSAKARHPHLTLGTYFSMPEWFNPDSGAGGYGFGTWPGHLARNAYDTSKVEPYTGRLPGRDWLRDQQLVKMKILAEKYQTHVMWCDIGGPNLTRTFMEDWIPFADKNNLQIVMNNRCGALPQFDTPEYAKFSSIQTQKWESSESVDPYSYGYNRYTKDEDYRSPKYLITSLVDIVSKNGNYLLNIGPDGDGVVPRPVVERLKAVGEWLEHSGDCIFGTDYFFFGAEAGPLRFTRTPDTFCIIAIERPEGERVVIDTPVPILPLDTISLLGAGPEGQNLTWTREASGTTVIHVGNHLLDKIHDAWAFQVKYTIPQGPQLTDSE